MATQRKFRTLERAAAIHRVAEGVNARIVQDDYCREPGSPPVWRGRFGKESRPYNTLTLVAPQGYIWKRNRRHTMVASYLNGTGAIWEAYEVLATTMEDGLVECPEGNGALPYCPVCTSTDWPHILFPHMDKYNVAWQHEWKSLIRGHIESLGSFGTLEKVTIHYTDGDIRHGVLYNGELFLK